MGRRAIWHAKHLGRRDVAWGGVHKRSRLRHHKLQQPGPFGWGTRGHGGSGDPGRDESSPGRRSVCRWVDSQHPRLWSRRVSGQRDQPRNIVRRPVGDPGALRYPTVGERAVRPTLADLRAVRAHPVLLVAGLPNQMGSRTPRIGRKSTVS